MVMLSKKIKAELNARVLKDCRINGAEIVAERMKVRNWKITLPKQVFDGHRTVRIDKVFIENFKGDDYDMECRKSELQKTVAPIGRIKYFTAEPY